MIDKQQWRRVKFGDVVQLNKERCANPAEAGVERYIGLEHIEPEDLRVRRWGLVSEGTTFTNLFRPGQVLFGKRRAYQRKVAVADFTGVCSGDIYAFESKDASVLLPELLPFICQTDGFFDHAVGTSAGSLSPRTNWTQLAQYEFALPPLDEQRRIRCVLGACVNCVEALRVLDDTNNQLRMSTVKNLFSSPSGNITPFGRIPSNWSYVRLSSVTTSSSFGPRFSSALYSDDGNVKTIRTTDFQEQGGLDLINAPIATLPNKVVLAHRLLDGDFLLSRSGEYAGMVRVFRVPPSSPHIFIPSAFLIRFRLDQEQILPEYLFELLDSPKGNAVARSLARGSAQPNITGTEFLNLHIPIPPVDTQRRIVAILTEVRSKASSLELRKRSSIQFLKKYTNLMLSI
ncbi:MAG: restriction endonuclease subunit S [Caldilineaceae bacterium]|nr:restriction endonuclease subunit S [Caldilineaceae bacterium]